MDTLFLLLTLLTGRPQVEYIGTVDGHPGCVALIDDTSLLVCADGHIEQS